MGNETFYWDSLNPIFFRVRNGDCSFKYWHESKAVFFFYLYSLLFQHLKSLYTNENFLEIKGNYKIESTKENSKNEDDWNNFDKIFISAHVGFKDNPFPDVESFGQSVVHFYSPITI